MPVRADHGKQGLAPNPKACLSAKGRHAFAVTLHGRCWSGRSAKAWHPRSPEVAGNNEGVALCYPLLLLQSIEPEPHQPEARASAPKRALRTPRLSGEHVTYLAGLFFVDAPSLVTHIVVLLLNRVEIVPAKRMGKVSGITARRVSPPGGRVGFCPVDGR